MRENIWFTADTHFGHANIIKYCKRPFAHVDENDETIIRNWNDVVGQHDEVYHLGDFGFGRPARMKEILRRLNGRIYLIKGNHDKSVLHTDVAGHFQWIKDYFELKLRDKDSKQNIILCHFAFQVWNKSHHGSWHLHGHSHGTLPSSDNQVRLDVGVDSHNFYPISYRKVESIMSRKVFKPIDHHGKR